MNNLSLTDDAFTDLSLASPGPNRNRYLENQLVERDDRIKLLTDSKHTKRSLMTRFIDWLKGGK